LNRELRTTLRERTFEILRERAMAALLVTHDAEEALAVADRISVLHQGVLLQTGTPRELYLTPRTLEVATSLGDALVLEAQPVGSVEVLCALGRVAVHAARAGRLVLRPEQLRVRAGAAGEGAAARVVARRWLGAHEEITLELTSGERLRARQPPSLLAEGERDVRVAVEGPGSCV
jgi:iron(III) transport system ATP-binding protein